MLGFTRALFQAHGEKIVRNLTDAVVDLDPKTASEAQLKAMESSLDDVGKKVTEIRTAAQADRTEATGCQARFDRMNLAANALNARFAAETDPAKKDALQKSLEGLLTSLESLKSELDADLDRAKIGEQQLAELEAIYQEKAAEWKSAKATLEHAQRDMEMAKVDQQRAAEQAERAAEIAGLRDGKVEGVNAALSSMTRQTAEAKAQAETLRMKTGALTHADTGSMDDPNVLAALAAVTPAPSTQSFADRLAALGK